MLVLTRKVGEAIMLGDDIEISVLEVHSHEIKIGISAPKSVVILRKEIFDAIKKENEVAARSKANDPNIGKIAKKFKKVNIKVPKAKAEELLEEKPKVLSRWKLGLIVLSILGSFLTVVYLGQDAKASFLASQKIFMPTDLNPPEWMDPKWKDRFVTIFWKESFKKDSELVTNRRLDQLELLKIQKSLLFNPWVKQVKALYRDFKVNKIKIDGEFEKPKLYL